MRKDRKDILLRVKPRHPAILLAGLAIGVFAVSLDALGLGRPGSLGIGQALLLTLGGFVGALGHLGVRRFAAFYRGAALVS